MEVHRIDSIIEVSKKVIPKRRRKKYEIN